MTIPTFRPSSPFRFRSFELDPTAAELRKQGALIRLKPQPLKVLVLLASHAGQVVSREQIQQEVWGSETFVDFEQGVNQCIKDIRLALGDAAETPRYIETLPRRGYRFVAPVEPLVPAPPASPPPATSARLPLWRWIAATTAIVIMLAAGMLLRPSLRSRAEAPEGKIMLAVLPFENLSGDPAREYLSDGFTEEMITQLGRLHPERLGVIARTSAMKYKGTRKSVAEIGAELGVGYVVEGSVRGAGDHLRVSAQLIQVSDQTHLWAESYERELRDVLDLESEVTLAIAAQIQLKLSPSQRQRLRRTPPIDPAVFARYLQGRYFETRGLETAREFFQQVVERDPSYAPAYAALASTYVVMGNWGTLPTKEALARAQEAARRALALDDLLPDAHLALAESTPLSEPALAEREYRRALELDPNHARAHQSYGLFLINRHEFEAALAHLKRAQELDPLSGIINANLAVGYFYLHRYDEAIAQSLRTLEVDPARITARIDLGRAYAQSGRYAQAVAEFEKVRDSGIEPRVAEALMHLTYTHARVRRTEDARRSLARLQEVARTTTVPAIYFVVCYASLGDTDRAFAWLDKAVDEGHYDVFGLTIDPEFESLRRDPRLPGVLRRLGP